MTTRLPWHDGERFIPRLEQAIDEGNAGASPSYIVASGQRIRKGDPMTASQSRLITTMAVCLIGLAAVAEGQDTRPTLRAATDKQIQELRDELKKANEGRTRLQTEFDKMKERADIQREVHDFYSSSVTTLGILAGILVGLLSIVITGIGIGITVWVGRRERKRDEASKEAIQESTGISEDFLKAHMLILQGQTTRTEAYHDHLARLSHFMEAIEVLVESRGFDAIANTLIPAVEGVYFACVNINRRFGVDVAPDWPYANRLLDVLGKAESKAAGTGALAVMGFQLSDAKAMVQRWLLAKTNPNGDDDEPASASEPPAEESNAESDAKPDQTESNGS